MKANEAPEKIILSADKETGKLYDEWVIRDLTDNIKIEYVRTDAFIEKACDAYCAICDTKECCDTGECVWVEKFRRRLMK